MIDFGVKSVLPSRQLVAHSANSCIFCSYKFPLPQPMQNQHLRHPFASVHSKGTLTPLNSTLTDTIRLTPAESTLTKNGGVAPPGTGSNAKALPAISHESPVALCRCYHPRSVPLPN